MNARRRAFALVAGLVALGCAAGPVHAQLPADARWSSLRTENFRVTWHDGLDSVARHAAAAAERARAALLVFVAEPPSGIIDIVVADNVDFSNGYATPFPSNRVVVYASPPVDALELQYTADWLEMVLVHELAHVFHLDVSGAVGTAIRRIFGRVPLPWPVFGALGSPGWAVEGLATHVESALTGYGRTAGSYHEMVVRTAILNDEFVGIDELGSSSRDWPGGTRRYIYGSLFFDYLARRHGADAVARVVDATAGALVPAPLWFGGVGRSAFGMNFRTAYTAWRAELETRNARLADSLMASGITASEPLTRHGGWALHPRHSPDGEFIAYARSDWRSPPRTQVVRAADGQAEWSRRRNDITPPAWANDGSLVVADLEYQDRFRIFSDVHTETAGGTRRLTQGQRIQAPDIGHDGRMVAVQNGRGSNRLVVRNQEGEWLPLGEAEAGVHWALPRFSPDGTRIAVGEWRAGGDYSITVLDTAGTRLWRLPRAPGISSAPAWTPDGRWILFWSDRTGIPNLFAVDPADESARVHQVTNVLTGAYFPDVSPDGQWIAFSAYHHDGFRIERIRFDTATWRSPLVRHEVPGAAGEHAMADATTSLNIRTSYADAGTVRLQQAIAAAAAADTTIHSVGRYRAWASARPYAWAPMVLLDGDNGYYGASLFGSDLVGRHDWALGIAVSPRTGRTEGYGGYRFNGMPVLSGGLHPGASISMSREWYVEVEPESDDGPFIEEREDFVSLDVDLVRPRWRHSIGFGVGGELVRLSRELNRGGNLRLRDPHDDLVGVRSHVWFSRYSSPAAAISRQDGVILQLAGRRRWERNPQTQVIDDRNVVFDRGYSELTSWNTAYRSFDLPGFSRHVLAARFSGLLRAGPNVSRSALGGVSTTGVAVPALGPGATGASLLLPLRGFDRGVRHGTRAWSASAEYRAPLARTGLPLRPLPLFLDRVSSTAFLDAGDAWCDHDTAARLPANACAATGPGTPLFSAGLELTFWMSAWGAEAPVRLGIAQPLSSVPAERSSRFWIVGGHSF